MSRIVDNLWLAARQFRRAPMLGVTVVVTLALVVGSATSVFSVVYTVLFRALPFERQESLVWITSVRPDRDDGPFTLPEFMDLSEQARTVELAAIANWSANLATDEGALRLQGMRMTANAFAVLGARAAVGRPLQPEDEAPSAPPVALLGYALWQSQFGGDPGVVGRTIRLDAQPYTVVGVLPQHFPLPLRGMEVAASLAPEQHPLRHERNSASFLRVVGRLAEGTASTVAEQELTGITQELREQFPVEYASRRGVKLTGLRETLVGDDRQSWLVLLGAVLLLCGIALANLTGLLLIRATVKKRDIAVRRAIGAGRGHLVGQLLAEGGLLAFVGGGVGTVLASGVVATLASRAPWTLPRLQEVRVDARALLFTLGLTALATVVMSLAPLLVAARTPAQHVLRAAGGGRVGGWEQHTRHGLVVAEIALAVALLSATVLLATSYRRLQQVELGFEPDGVFMARVSLPAERYAELPAMVAFHRNLHDRLAALPGVESVGAIFFPPLSGLLARVPFDIVGHAIPAEERPVAQYRVASPGYFETVGTRVVQGRGFGERDDERAPPVALINQALARQRFPGVNPIGRRLRLDDNNDAPREVEIVGVVEDVRQTSLDGPTTLDIYLPWPQAHNDWMSLLASYQYWVLRTPGKPLALQPAFARELRAVDADAAAAEAGLMRDTVDVWLAPRRFNAGVLLAFGVAALLLAATGIYGVMAYSVALRRREIGLRMALGATRRSIAAWLLSQTARLVALGVGLGLALAWAARRALAGLLFGVAPGDPAILAMITVALLAVAWLASYLPTRRATRVDPMTVLREE